MHTIYIYSYFPTFEKESFQLWYELILKEISSLNTHFIIFTHSPSYHLEDLHHSIQFIYLYPQIEPFLSYAITNKIISLISSPTYQFTSSSSIFISSSYSSSSLSTLSSLLHSTESIFSSEDLTMIGSSSSLVFNSKVLFYYQLFLQQKEKDHFDLPSFLEWMISGQKNIIYPTPSYSKYLLCYTFGGLGNMLYQVTTAIALSIEYQYQPVILYDPKYIENYRAPTFRFSNNHYFIFDNICRLYREKIPSNIINYHEPNNQYQPGLYEFMNHHKDSNQPLSLTGYFQSTKYFKKHWKVIQTHFLNLSKFESICKEFIFQLRLSQSLFSKKLISIHIRGTDYLKHSDHYVILTPSYYQNIIENIIFHKHKKEDCYFVIFTDDKEYVQSNFSFLFSSSYSSIFVQDILGENISYKKYKKNDEFELLFMSQFDILICANSSFSLFSSYLSNSNEIYLPKKWIKHDSDPQSIDNFILHDSYFPI